MKQTFAFLAASFFLSTACASSGGSGEDPSGVRAAANSALRQTGAGLGQAAMAPLEDLNLKRDEIPRNLRRISNPYDVDTQMSCEAIAREVSDLDAVLGRDWDAGPDTGDDDSLSQLAADKAADGMLGAVASEARGLIPYRGWVRKLSGADGHERDLRTAREKGAHRRTFLKGLGASKGCDLPGARPDLQAIAVKAGEPEEDTQKPSPSDYEREQIETALPRDETPPLVEDTILEEPLAAPSSD